MAAEKVDRRVRRTKELLRRALLELILEKGYARVTVQEIIDRADVGRSTFYAHFRDKEDLLVDGLEELREALAPNEGDGVHPGSASLAVFEHFRDSQEVWGAMAGRRGADAFVRHLHEFLLGLVYAQLRARAPQGPTRVPVDALAEFAVSTMIGLGVRWWRMGEEPVSAREVDRLYRELTEPAIEAGLRPVDR